MFKMFSISRLKGLKAFWPIRDLSVRTYKFVERNVEINISFFLQSLGPLPTKKITVWCFWLARCEKEYCKLQRSVKSNLNDKSYADLFINNVTHILIRWVKVLNKVRSLGFTFCPFLRGTFAKALTFLPISQKSAQFIVKPSIILEAV